MRQNQKSNVKKWSYVCHWTIRLGVTALSTLDIKKDHGNSCQSLLSLSENNSILNVLPHAFDTVKNGAQFRNDPQYSRPPMATLFTYAKKNPALVYFNA